MARMLLTRPRTRLRVRLTSMLDQRVSFDLRLTAVSPDGFIGVIQRHQPVPDRSAGPFWAEFVAPGHVRPLECVARPVDPAGRPGRQRLSRWAYCAGEDPRLHRSQATRLKELLAAPRHVRAPSTLAQSERRR